MRYRFVCAEHEDFGEKGWRQEGQPDYDPLSGTAVAHDILEHFPRGTGSPADELQALGASFVVRGEDYYCQKGRYITSPALNAASDMGEIISHILYEHMPLPSPPPYRNRTDEYGDWVTEFLRATRKELRDRFDDPEDQANIRQILTKTPGWLYRGIVRAKRRYRNHRDWTVNMFCEIEHEADRLLRYAEIGDVLTVQVRKHQVRCDLSNPPE